MLRGIGKTIVGSDISVANTIFFFSVHYLWRLLQKKCKYFRHELPCKFLKCFWNLAITLITLDVFSITYIINKSIKYPIIRWCILSRVIMQNWCRGERSRNWPEFLWVRVSQRMNIFGIGLWWLLVQWHGLFFINFHGIPAERLGAASYPHECLLDTDLLQRLFSGRGVSTGLAPSQL